MTSLIFFLCVIYRRLYFQKDIYWVPGPKNEKSQHHLKDTFINILETVTLLQNEVTHQVWNTDKILCYNGLLVVAYLIKTSIFGWCIQRGRAV